MKEQLSSRFMAYLVALATAVGLGNLWKFPTMTGENGGASFVLVYIIASLIVGIPLVIAEFILGRHSKTNLLDVVGKLKTSPYWNIMSWLALIGNFFIVVFYTVIVGWVYLYLFKAIKGDFASPTPDALVNTFGDITSSPSAFVAQMIVLSLVGFVLYRGLSGGIEKALRILSPIFLVLLLVVFINSLRLEGFGEAMDFLFTFDMSKIDSSVIMGAFGLAFFKLSVGTGCMLTYGSYFQKQTNLKATAVTVSIADVLVSLLAGMSLFPVVFTFGLEPTSGAGLLFNTVPLAFSNIPVIGNLLTIVFFALAAIVGTTATISLCQVHFAVLRDKVNVPSWVKPLILVGGIGLISLLTNFPFSPLADVSVFGYSFFDAFDQISSNILLPLSGLMLSIFIGYAVKREVIDTEIGINTTTRVWYAVVHYIIPIILTYVFINGIIQMF
ncbi:MAG: sodium-dependent transporter [Bacilli bacterium]